MQDNEASVDRKSLSSSSSSVYLPSLASDNKDQDKDSSTLPEPPTLNPITSITKHQSRRAGPIIIDDKLVYNVEHFSVYNHYKDTVESILIPHGLIMDRIDKLAKDIREDYGDITIHLLCVLKGGSTFFHDLVSRLRNHHKFNECSHIPFTFDFIRVKSYKGTESSGDVKITTLGADIAKLEGKHCLLVEDIIDSGLTMSRLVPYLETLKPKSVKVASLLEKRTSRSCGFLADYVGFSIPDKFVIGYCLDYNEVYRDMLHIGVITPLGIERFKDGPPPLEGEDRGEN